MTDKVVDIRSRQPYLTGKAVCLHCRYTWVAVAEIGTINLECPKCETMQGVFDGVCAPNEYWQCQCGCAHFFITAEVSICCHCGLAQVFG